jgi:hypothetical protein
MTGRHVLDMMVFYWVFGVCLVGVWWVLYGCDSVKNLCVKQSISYRILLVSSMYSHTRNQPEGYSEFPSLSLSLSLSFKININYIYIPYPIRILGLGIYENHPLILRIS